MSFLIVEALVPEKNPLICESRVCQERHLPLSPWPRDSLPLSLDMQSSYTVHLAIAN